MRMKQRVESYFSQFSLLIGIVCIMAFFMDYGIRLNHSNSLPYYIFISKPLTHPLSKGEYVGFYHPILKLHAGKILIGLPGDQVRLENEKVFVNDTEIGLYQAKSASGISYNAIDAGTIPEGMAFVYTPSKDSYDSRYKEFGLVKYDWIVEALWPIF